MHKAKDLIVDETPDKRVAIKWESRTVEVDGVAAFEVVAIGLSSVFWAETTGRFLSDFFFSW